ncbi:hypothetical protein JXL19_12725 [bacterium]|nr:hypothetical protein [bacterium]
MKDRTCINCSEFKRCRENSASWLFFIIGMIATIAVRVVTVLSHLNPVYGQMAWYIGVSGFFVFFIYKFRIERQRYRLILNSKLMEKVSQGKALAAEDREMISSILCALSSNKDRINYLLIFVSSALAIIVALYLDLLK